MANSPQGPNPWNSFDPIAHPSARTQSSSTSSTISSSEIFESSTTLSSIPTDIIQPTTASDLAPTISSTSSETTPTSLGLTPTSSRSISTSPSPVSSSVPTSSNFDLTPTSSNPSLPTNNPPSSPTSRTALITGITFALGSLLLVIAALTVYCVIRKRRRRLKASRKLEAKNEEHGPVESRWQDKPELDGVLILELEGKTNTEPRIKYAELDGVEAVELEAEYRAVELANAEIPVEADTTTHQLSVTRDTEQEDIPPDAPERTSRVDAGSTVRQQSSFG
ncbi:unnamed protein product [Periconia digitata]|uniref:Uncharacterized protein n=1 Tax=Periconia digitata TaxID=1303443 RepID=A0A9W4XJ79_9PLEO|nr:unnamed protein product [Periconia digitata]